MSRKQLLKPYRLLTAQSLAASFQTVATNMEQLDYVSYVISTSGITDNTGTFGVEVRYVYPNTAGPETSAWIPLTLSLVPTLADVDDDITITVQNEGWSEIRLAFTAAGGTPDGTAVVSVSGTTRGA